VEYSSYNRITENVLQSIGKGTGVLGVGSSEPARQRVRRGDEPLQTPRAPVPFCHLPLYIIATDAKGLPVLRKSLGAESSEPASPVATAPKAADHSDRREASPSLESSKPNAHTHPEDCWFRVPCAGWLREMCSHNGVRWMPLACHRWECEYCAPGKFMELQERLRGAMTLSKEKGWMWRGGRTGFFLKGSWTLKFVTLTWADDVTGEQVRLHLQHLVQAIRRKYGYCEYAKVPEWTKNHRIHLHLAMIMPYIPQQELSRMWRKVAGAPIVWITAVRDVQRLQNELGKYLAKGPAGKVSYSRNFPKAEPLVVVKPGPCDACDGKEHTFMFLPVGEAEKSFPLEVRGRDDPGLAIKPTGGLAPDCGCWPERTPG